MPPPSKLAIATSSLQRLIKEEASYHKEQQQQVDRIAKLQADQSDENAEYMLKQEQRALEETKTLIPTLQARIKSAVETLESQLSASKGSSETSPEDITKAEELLGQAKKTTAV